jgi:hypothetical protein
MNEMEMMKKKGRGMAKADMQEMMPMKKGGMVKTAKKTKARSSCDGIAKKGRTKGRMV